MGKSESGWVRERGERQRERETEKQRLPCLMDLRGEFFSCPPPPGTTCHGTSTSSAGTHPALCVQAPRTGGEKLILVVELNVYIGC